MRTLEELIAILTESIQAYEAGYEADLATLEPLAEEADAAIKSLDSEKLAESIAEDASVQEHLEAFIALEEKISGIYTELKAKHDAEEAARVERAASILAKIQEKAGKTTDVLPGEDSAQLETGHDVSKGKSTIDAQKLVQRKVTQPKVDESAGTESGSKYKIYNGTNRIDTSTGTRIQVADEVTWNEVAATIASTNKTRINVGTVAFDESVYDVVDNGDGTFMEQVIEKRASLSQDFDVLSASSVCARETDFSVSNLSSGCAKFANSLLTVRGRKVMEWYRSVYADLSDPANIGGGVWTDADYDNPDAVKQCNHAACGNKVSCDLVALYWCFELNRFQELSHPEQVAALKELMDVYFNYRLENLALKTYMDTAFNSAPLTVSPAVFGANIDISRGIARVIGQLSDTIGYQGNWDVWLPSQAYRKLAGDALASPFREMTNLESQINAIGDGGNVRLGEYCGTAAGTTIPAIPGGAPLTSAAFGAQVLPSSFSPFTPGTGGPVPAYPLTNRILFAPAGAGVRNVLGEINIDTVETITVNNTKKVFFEQENQFCFPGAHWFGDFDLCDSGATGGFVSYACA